MFAPGKRDGEELNPNIPPAGAGGEVVVPKSPGLLVVVELNPKPPPPKAGAGAAAGEVLKLKEGFEAAAGAAPNMPPPNEGVDEKRPTPAPEP